MLRPDPPPSSPAERSSAVSRARVYAATHLEYLNADLRGAVREDGAGALERGDLVAGRALAAGNNRASVARRRPVGAVRPAVNATTAFGRADVLLCASRYAAASSSLLPPIFADVLVLPRAARRYARSACSSPASVLKPALAACCWRR
jgi:hypothetical protein